MIDLLKIMKRVFNILDFSGVKLKDLIEEILKQYFILQLLLDYVLGDKDIYLLDECEVGLFWLYVGIFFVLVVYGLFLGMFESVFLDDCFYQGLKEFKY